MNNFKREQYFDQLSQFSGLLTNNKVKDTGSFQDQTDINNFLNTYQKKTTGLITDSEYVNNVKELVLKQYSDQSYLMDCFDSLLNNEFALYSQFSNFNMGKHIAVQSAMNCEAFNNVNGEQQRVDFFTSCIDGENLSFISNYIVPNFGTNIDCSIVQNEDGSISVKKSKKDINIILVEYDSTQEYDLVLKHNDILNYFRFNNKFFIFYNKHTIDHTFKTLLNQNTVVPKKILQFFVDQNFRQNFEIKPLNIFKNFTKINILNDFYCQQNGQLVSQNLTLKYGPYKKTFMFEDQSKTLSVGNYVLSDTKHTIPKLTLKKNDNQIFGNIQYDFVKAKYFTYSIITQQQLDDLDKNKFIIETQEELELYDKTNDSISNCFLQKIYKTPIVVNSKREYNNEYNDLKALQCLDKFQTISDDTKEQSEHQIIQKKYKQNKVYPVLFSTSQFVKSSQFNITGLDTVLHTVKSFCNTSTQNQEADQQTKVTFEIDQIQKSIFVQDDKFKIQILDPNIRKDLASVIQHCEYTKTDNTKDTFVSLINPQNITETFDQQNKRYWSFQIPITIDLSSLQSVQYIHVYIQKTDQVQPIPQDGIINFGFMNKPLYKLWIINQQYSEVPVQIVYRQKVNNNFIDFSEFINIDDQILVKINELSGSSNKLIFFCEQQEEFSLSRDAELQTTNKDIVTIDNVTVDNVTIDNSYKILENNEFYFSYSLNSILPQDHFCKKEQTNKYAFPKLRETSTHKTNYLQDSLRCFEISFEKIQIKDSTQFTSSSYLYLNDKNSIFSKFQNKYNINYLSQCQYTNKDGQLVTKNIYKLPYFKNFDKKILYKFALTQQKDKQFVLASLLGYTELIFQQETDGTNKKYVLYIKKNQDLEPISVYINGQITNAQQEQLFYCSNLDKVFFVLENKALKNNYILSVYVNDTLKLTLSVDSLSQSFIINKQLFDIDDLCQFSCFKDVLYEEPFDLQLKTEFIFNKDIEYAQYVPIKNFLLQYF